MEFKKGDKVLVEGEIERSPDGDDHCYINFAYYAGPRMKTTVCQSIVLKEFVRPLDKPKPQGNCKHWEGVNCGSCVAEHCRHKPGMNISVSMWENCPFQETRKEAPGVWDEIEKEFLDHYRSLGKVPDTIAQFQFIKDRLKEKGHDIR